MSWRSAVAATTVVGTVAAAQSYPGATGDTLPAVVVTATKVAAATTVPTASTTVIDGAALRAQGITRLADALRLVPGVTIVPSGAVGSLTSMFVRGGNSNYVRVLVDGVPVNDAGGGVDLANFTTGDVDRIEVVRGPAGVLYGSDAVTGVVQVFTRAGGGRASGWSLGAGSRGARRADASRSGGRPRAGYFLGATHERTDGILAFNNAYESGVLSGGATLVPDARTAVRLAARWSAATFHFPTDYTGAVVDRNAEQSDHRLTVGIDAGRHLSPHVELRASLTAHEYLPRTNDWPDDAGDTTGFFGFLSRTVRTRRGADVRLNIRSARRQTLTLGVDVARERERGSSTSLSEYGTSHDGFEAARHGTGLYAQLLGDVGGKVSWTAGVRLDRSSAFGDFATARAALGWQAAPRLRVRAAAGNAFKAPSFFENYATGFVTGNPALAPETSRSAELGAELAFGGAATLAATGFVQQFENIVQYNAAAAAGAPNYHNVAAARAGGLEVEARLRTAYGVTTTLGWSFTDTRVTAAGFDASAGANYVKGERLIRRPPHVVTASMARSFADGGSWHVTAARVGARADRDFSQYPAAPVTVPAYLRVDVASVVPLRPTASLIVRGDNVLDARYQDVVGFPAPGATFFAGLRFGRPGP